MRGCASKLACGHRIGPAECAVFTGVFGEFVTSQWVDVGIGPYRVLCKVPPHLTFNTHTPYA